MGWSVHKEWKLHGEQPCCYYPFSLQMDEACISLIGKPLTIQLIKMDEVCSFCQGGAYILRHFSLGCVNPKTPPHQIWCFHTREQNFVWWRYSFPLETQSNPTPQKTPPNQQTNKQTNKWSWKRKKPIKQIFAPYHFYVVASKIDVKVTKLDSKKELKNHFFLSKHWISITLQTFSTEHQPSSLLFCLLLLYNPIVFFGGSRLWWAWKRDRPMWGGELSQGKSSCAAALRELWPPKKTED